MDWKSHKFAFRVLCWFGGTKLPLVDSLEDVAPHATQPAICPQVWKYNTRSFGTAAHALLSSALPRETWRLRQSRPKLTAKTTTKVVKNRQVGAENKICINVVVIRWFCSPLAPINVLYLHETRARCENHIVCPGCLTQACLFARYFTACFSQFLCYCRV